MSARSMEYPAGLQKEQFDAGHEFSNATMAALKVPGGIHVPTVIAAGARMAGTYVFRSLNLDVPGIRPGQVVLSPAVNERADRLAQVTARVLQPMGIRIADSPPPSWNDQKHRPTLQFLDTQRKLEPVFGPIRAKYSLGGESAAEAAAIGTALLIRHCATALDPNIAFGIAVYGFIEGSKTAPDPIDDPSIAT